MTPDADAEPITGGKLLRARRVELALRLEDVARRAGVSTALISMLENGYRPRRTRRALELVASAVESDAEEIWPTEEARA